MAALQKEGSGEQKEGREYLTPPPCFNTDVVKYREINHRYELQHLISIVLITFHQL